MLDLSKFQAMARDLLPRPPHRAADLAGLDGSNWRLKDYEARGGYAGPAQDPRRGRRRGMTPEQVIAEVKASACAAAAAPAFRPA